MNMWRGLRLFLYLGAVASLEACFRKSPVDDIQVALRVNGEAISRASFERELFLELQSLEGAQSRTPEQIEPFKQALIQSFIEKTLLLQEARSRQLTVTTEEVDRKILSMRADFPSASFEETLAKNHSSLDDLKRQTEEQLLLEKVIQTQVFARVAATEQEIRQYFQTHEAEFQRPEKVRASQIYLQGADDARRALQLVRSGQKFAEVARKLSQAPEAKNGGDLGAFPRGIMPPQFDEVLFKMSVGQISDVVATDFGYHIFQVTERLPARMLTFDEAHLQVEARVLQPRRQKAQEDFLAKLRAKADIRINTDALALVTGAKP